MLVLFFLSHVHLEIETLAPPAISAKLIFCLFYMCSLGSGPTAADTLHSGSLSSKRRKGTNRSYNDLLAGLAQLENG